MDSPDTTQSQPPKRPAAPRRSHSSQSQSTQSQHSPSDGAPHHRSAHTHTQHKAQRHVVGHGRLGPRNPSYGKNLNKQAAQQQHHINQHHHRTLSTGSTSTSTADAAARPALKRNASAAVVSRNTSHAQLRKNHSSGHLPRQASSKAMHRHNRSSDLEPLTKRGSTSSAATVGGGASAKPRRKSSPEMDHAGVRFDLGVDEDNDDNDWTEESASQSPATTRSTTRQNSVILDPPKAQQQPPPQQDQTRSGLSDNDTSDSTETDSNPRRPEPNRTRPPQQQDTTSESPSPRNTSRTQPSQQRVTYSSNQINGVNSYHQPNLPDADMITSRILQRSTSNRLQPQVSDVSATVVSNSHDARSLSHSTGSTMIDTPGNKEAVSRFIDGDGSSGTPRDSSFLPHHPRPTNNTTTGDLAAKRNKSTANIAENSSATTPPSSSTHHRRHVSSGTTTPSDLAPSRTQQKLWLQRASSNIEPQQKQDFLMGAPHHHRGSIPGPTANGHHTHLPHHRHSSSQLVVVGGVTPLGDVVMDRELARRFDDAAAEYRVVRRFRNPVADAIARLADSPDSPRWRYVRERVVDSNPYQQQRHLSTASASSNSNSNAYYNNNSNNPPTASPMSKAASSLNLSTHHRPSTQGGTDREVRTNGLRTNVSAAQLASPTTPMSPGGGMSALQLGEATPSSVMEAVAAARRARVSFDLPGRGGGQSPGGAAGGAAGGIGSGSGMMMGLVEQGIAEQQSQQQARQQQMSGSANDDVVEELCRRIWERCDGEGVVVGGRIEGA
ncbi:uncharacterized protein BKA78DRAFT_296083 [Phyllosticta capitalensis]|uniref:uncharacterized protein n=1 Tax=Phyllosticta capitalensis TaxID=121624 RepID=UPI0031317013